MNGLGVADYEGLLAWGATLGITDAPLPSHSATRSVDERACSSCLGESLCVASFPAAGGRGLAAVRDLKEGELVLRVPDLALMSCKTATEDPKLKQTLELFPALSSSQVLSIHLLNEVAKGSTSKWHQYLMHLPQTHHTLSHFSSFEAGELQDDDAMWTAKRAAQKVYADWQAVRPLLMKLGLIDRFTKFKAWLWATATVSTRSLHVPWDKAGALCPIGDFFNYAPSGRSCNALDLGDQNSFDTYRQLLSPSAAQRFDNEDESGFGLCVCERFRDGGYDAKLGAYCFYAREDYQKGQQVLLCYGQYSDLELLEYYGFLLPDNPSNMVYLSPPTQIEFGDNNFDMNIQEPACGNGFYITSNGSPSFSLLAAMRLSAASPTLRKSHGYHAFSGMQLSVEGDCVVYGWLSDKCKKLLESFPTTIQEDSLLLAILSTFENLSGKHGLCSFLSEVSEGRRNIPDLLEIDELACPVTIPENVIKQLVQIVGFAGSRKASPQNLSIAFYRCIAAIKWRLTHKSILEHCVLYTNHKLRLLNKDP